ncbi:hypothetical protein [Spiroplasma ixodetis]|nr:hypothetical protein [Spiroplasma ixodetis]
MNNIKLKNNDISQNELFKLDDNQFNWLSITNELESNNIPSLIPADWTLGNGEYGKYFTRAMIDKNKIENALNLYGSNKYQLFSKLELAFLPLCTILILSHKCWEKPIYGLLSTFLNQT